MASLNKVLLMGNITRDIELRYTPRGTAVADISIAINRSWKDDSGNRQDETTFVDCTLWGKTAELAHKYLAKGRGIFVEGRLQMESWDDKDTGKKRTKMKIIGENIQFLPSGDRNASQSSSQSSPPPQSSHTSQAPPPSYASEENDIPF